MAFMLQHPSDLSHGLPVIRDVLQHMAADDEVERVIRKRQRSEVESGVVGRPYVSRDVSLREASTEMSTDLGLRSEMEGALHCGKIQPSIEERPHQPVALESTTGWTAGVRSTPVLGKSTERPPAGGAIDGRTA